MPTASHNLSRMPGASSERNTGTPRPSGARIPRQGATFPPLGTWVKFQRSPTHHPENGTVLSRQFGTGIIEVNDMNDGLLRLSPDQYEVLNHEDAC